DGWRGLPPGAEVLAEAGLRPADPRAAADFHRRTRAEPSLTIHGIDSGRATEFRTSIPVEATARFSLRPGAGQSADEVALAFERLIHDACPAGATVSVEWLFRYNGAATPFQAPELDLAAAAIERNFGRRPALVRSGASLPLLETLASRGIPAIATAFPFESDGNMHGPNEPFPRANLELGLTTVSGLLGELGASPPASRASGGASRR